MSTTPARGFTMLEVMISIAVLAILSAALITFTFGLGGRRDRMVREGERGAMLARVLDRVERAASTAHDHAGHGPDWLELEGRGVWPAAGRAGVPAGPVGFTGRLAFAKDAGELTWTETTEAGDSMALVVRNIEAVVVDHFDDLVTASGSQPPLRVCVWLAPVGRAAPQPQEEDAPDGEAMPGDPSAPLMDEDALPERPADVVFVVAGPRGIDAGGAGGVAP
jgi:prepilin-type N-terminal cleavage/methylation domain-containing protein